MTDHPFRTFEGLPPEVEAVIEAAKAWYDKYAVWQEGGWLQNGTLSPEAAAVWRTVEALREPPVKRYVVELRVPQEGERYLHRDEVLSAETYIGIAPRPVIVGESDVS